MKEKIECFRCGSDLVVRGKVIGHRGYKPRFLPEQSKFFKLALSTPFLKIEYESYVCLDCGLFWSVTDSKAAKDKIKEWGRKELKSRLNLK